MWETLPRKKKQETRECECLHGVGVSEHHGFIHRATEKSPVPPWVGSVVDNTIVTPLATTAVTIIRNITLCFDITRCLKERKLSQLNNGKITHENLFF